VVSLAITHYRAHVDRVYGWDLAGAGLAALAVGVSIRLFGGPGLVALVALLACIAGVLFDGLRARAIAAAVVAAGLFVASQATVVFDPPSAKSVRAERVVFDAWNTFSHITVERMSEGKYDIRIDSAARTPIAHARDTTSTTWMNDITSIGYTVHPGGAQKALIIGPGGGIDVARALASGVKHVTAVEINPLIADDIMRGKFQAASGGLYRDPRITIVVDEGRSFVRRTGEKYDVLQLSMVDTWAATASGAFALTENTLYTVEAFEDYYNHLTDGGIVTLTRWWSFLSGPETIRATILAAAALERIGVPPGTQRAHIYLAKHDNFGTLLVKKSPFTPDEIARLDDWCTKLKHESVLTPTRENHPGLAALLKAGPWSAAVANYADDITPPTDDRPFFFYFVKPSQMWSGGIGSRISNPAIWLLGALSAVLVVLTVVFVFVPLVLRRWSDLRVDGERGAMGRRVLGLSYFAAIGFAFMVVEIALMQRLSLFLGHPSYSLVVVLFAILIGTSIGARLSRFTGRPGLGSALAAFVVAVFAVIAGALLADMLRQMIAISLTLRMIVSALIVLVFGLAMGLMLPLGVRLVSAVDPAIVPWAWGINGGMSVIGTVGATVIAIHGGFGVTFFVGAALYVVAGGIGLMLERSRTDAV
jgi:spermidine synthase